MQKSGVPEVSDCVCGGEGVTWTHRVQHLCSSLTPCGTQYSCGSTCLKATGVLRTQAREGGCQWLQTTSPSNSANPNKIGKRQWEEMIVSWLFSERKQKKNANRSTPCILVQNLGVFGEKNLQFLLLLVFSPDAGEGCLRWWGPGLLFLTGKGR